MIGSAPRRAPAVVLLTLLLAAASALLSGSAAARLDPGPSPSAGLGARGQDTAYISLLFSRSAWQATKGVGCSVVSAGARTLEQNAQDLQERGLSATALVVIDRTAEQDRSCFDSYMTQASWTDLARLRDEYGWSATSQGTSYADMTTMTNDQQRYAESTASLAPLAARGFPRAWGAFAFANNKIDPTAQAFVGRYFGFLRRYSGQTNTREAVIAPPYVMSTWSLNGGRCNNVALPCYSMTVVNHRRSANVVAVQKFLRPDAGQWSVLQAYRLVEGVEGVIGDGYAWDCSSPDWRDRWTSQPELTCRTSYLEMVDGRLPGAVVTDPTTVAEAWGRVPADYVGWPNP